MKDIYAGVEVATSDAVEKFWLGAPIWDVLGDKLLSSQLRV